jgi:hypothetical protein
MHGEHNANLNDCISVPAKNMVYSHKTIFSCCLCPPKTIITQKGPNLKLINHLPNAFLVKSLRKLLCGPCHHPV